MASQQTLPQSSPEKKAYQSPQLKQYGSFQNLTQGGSGPQQEMAAMTNTKKFP
jgi:hypothetical protein